MLDEELLVLVPAALLCQYQVIPLGLPAFVNFVLPQLAATVGALGVLGMVFMV